MSPKRYARIVRFRRALERVGSTDARIGTIAADLGYFDQAHLSGEFAAHAGMSPLAYRFATRYPGSDHLVDLGASRGPDLQDGAIPGR